MPEPFERRSRRVRDSATGDGDEEGFERTGNVELVTLALNPMDVARTYEAIIRVNSQSGKGGVAYVMETEHHPGASRSTSRRRCRRSRTRGGELTAAELMQTFRESHLVHTTPFELVAYTHSSEGDSDRIAARLLVDGEERIVDGEGNGPNAALVDALARGSASRCSCATTTSTRCRRGRTRLLRPTWRRRSTGTSSGASASTPRS